MMEWKLGEQTKLDDFSFPPLAQRFITQMLLQTVRLKWPLL